MKMLTSYRVRKYNFQKKVTFKLNLKKKQKLCGNHKNLQGYRKQKILIYC